MKKAYYLHFNVKVGTRDQVKAFLDSRPEILNWYTCMVDSFIIISEKTAAELGELFLQFTARKGRFILLHIDSDKYGFLPRTAWSFINNPMTVSEWTRFKKK